MSSNMSDEELMAAITAAEYSPARVATKGAPAPTQRTRASFSSEAVRVIVGGVSDAVKGTIDAADDLAWAADDWINKKTGFGGSVVFGREAPNGLIGTVPRREYERRTGQRAGFNTDAWLPKAPENQTAVGRFTRDITEFGTSFVTGSRAIKGLDALGTVARYGRVTLAGAGAAFVNVDPMEGNLANMAKALGVPQNALTEALAVDESDGALEARFKNAAADAVTGVAFDAGLKMLATGVRQLKALKNAKASVEGQAAAPMELAKPDPKMVESATRAVDETFNPKPAEAAPAGEQGALFSDLPPAAKPDPVDELESSLFNIPSKMEGLDEEALKALARSYHEGTGYEVMERLGLDPARIDFAKILSDGDPSVAKIREMTERVAEAVMPIASRAGSKPRTWTQTQMLANLVGSSEGQVIAAYKGKTELLDAYGWASRQLLAGSAVRLTKLAEAARGFVDSPTSAQYIEFLRALEAHAALQAQLKAATSNLGRALNSLKGTATARSSVEQAQRLKSIVGDAPGSAAAGPKISSAEDALRALADTTDPKQRKLLIEKVIKAGGDPEKIGRIAERGQGPARWQRATREFITGNLFSVGTATVNLLSTVGHIGFRALSRVPVHAAAYATGRAGRKEFVAQRVADTAYYHSLIPGFAKGFQNTMRLLSDELVTEFQVVAGSFGDNAVERGLGRLRQWMDSRWGAYEPRFERIDAARTREWIVSKDTVQALLDNHDQLPALMRLGMRGMVGIMTGAFNTVGATSRFIRAITIDTTDELLGAVAQQATRAAEATRMAALEGLDKGLSGEELAKYASQRADVLLKHSSTELIERIERLVALGAKEDSDEIKHLAGEALHALGIKDASEAEARKVLFQDDLEWELSQHMSRALPKMDMHTGVIFPFIKTPMKILETTLGDYTPLGLLQKETRERLMSGGIDAQIALSQIAMGTMAIGTTMGLAASGLVVGYDGGPRSSARAERPSYSMKIGDKWVEFSRFDPMGMLLGLGADLHEYLLNAEDEDGAPVPLDFEKAVSGMFLAVSRNILSKTWMTTMRDVVGLAGGGTDAQTQTAMERFGTSVIQKFVPAGGMMRWWEGTDDGVLREASTAWERVIASTPWASELPVRRDTLLGRPVKYDRILGIVAGDDDNDPLIRELADLEMDLPPNTKSFRGVELNTKQLARLKELRGQIVTDESGLTLEEQARELIGSSEWSEMSRSERVRAVRDLRDKYQPLAIEALREEDKEFDHAVGAVKLKRQLEKEGATAPEIDAELQAFKKEVLGQ